jgi:cyanate permease
MSNEAKMSEPKSQELDLTPVEGDKPMPVGWLALFFGLIAFGVYYFIAYTPAITGWSQADALAAGAGSGGNIFATILFTVLAVAAVASILFALSRRRG